MDPLGPHAGSGTCQWGGMEPWGPVLLRAHSWGALGRMFMTSFIWAHVGYSPALAAVCFSFVCQIQQMQHSQMIILTVSEAQLFEYTWEDRWQVGKLPPHTTAATRMAQVIQHLERKFGARNFFDMRVQRSRVDKRQVLLEHDTLVLDLSLAIRDVSLGTFVEQGWCIHIVDIDGEDDYFTFGRTRLVSPPTPTPVDKNSKPEPEPEPRREPLREPQSLDEIV